MQNTPALNYLDFEHSEDADGVATFEAMASVVGAAQVAAVHAEVAQVLSWAHRHFGDSRGPVDEGFDWDHDLQGQAEYTAVESLHFDEATGRISAQLQAPGVPRHSVTLAISASPAFADAFRQAFALG